MYNFLSLFTGILITIMVSFNGVLSQAIGNYSSSLIIHLSGFIILLVIILLKKYKISFKKKLPIILYSAEVIGVFTVIFNNISFKGLGASLTISLALLGQTISSFIIDSYGLMGMKKVRFENKKIFGLSIITSGIIIMTFF
ncbi:DMT family transporter [Clostridium sp.]|uniref:DMT family transporter n=1 Tax=Clostridium sp. TaxID=1506 RepID=UPI001EB65481|nr:DMT family transporter [Clostridium sp.]MBS5886885.1 DMT family transporter [Clostridium sp.]